MNRLERASLIAPWCFVAGALLGLAGSFAPSAPLRGLAWGADGTALIVGAAVLANHFFRHGHEQLAAGFLVFIAGSHGPPVKPLEIPGVWHGGRTRRCPR